MCFAQLRPHLLQLGMPSLAESVELLDRFASGDLSWKLSDTEYKLQRATVEACCSLNSSLCVDQALLQGAAELKRVAGQINVVIHALGILYLLPQLLEKGETIEYVSLGAGNTGRKFDLETDRRIAEFKFIAWRGGPEVIRQNSIFKDFFYLAEEEGPKKRYLYVLDSKHPLKFFRSGRALKSILSRLPKVADEFRRIHGDEITKVGEYYELKRDVVEIVDVSGKLPSALLAAAAQPEQASVAD